MSLSIFLLRLFGLVIGLLFVGFFVSERREKRRREREGFWVEVLFYGQLRGEEDAWAVVYHEENKTLWFTGIIAPRRQ